jgi:hypothetical protein
MTYAAFPEMSHRRLLVFLALAVPAVLWALVQPFIWPGDASYLIASIAGAGVLSVLADWSLPKRWGTNGRALAFAVDLLMFFAVATAVLVWGDSLGWFRWVILVVLVVFTGLGVLKRVQQSGLTA